MHFAMLVLIMWRLGSEQHTAICTWAHVIPSYGYGVKCKHQGLPSDVTVDLTEHLTGIVFCAGMLCL